MLKFMAEWCRICTGCVQKMLLPKDVVLDFLFLLSHRLVMTGIGLKFSRVLFRRTPRHLSCHQCRRQARVATQAAIGEA
jgi:hypothetical protein